MFKKVCNIQKFFFKNLYSFNVGLFLFSFSNYLLSQSGPAILLKTFLGSRPGSQGLVLAYTIPPNLCQSNLLHCSRDLVSKYAMLQLQVSTLVQSSFFFATQIWLWQFSPSNQALLQQVSIQELLQQVSIQVQSLSVSIVAQQFSNELLDLLRRDQTHKILILYQTIFHLRVKINRLPLN